MIVGYEPCNQRTTRLKQRAHPPDLQRAERHHAGGEFQRHGDRLLAFEFARRAEHRDADGGDACRSCRAPRRQVPAGCGRGREAILSMFMPPPRWASCWFIISSRPSSLISLSRPTTVSVTWPSSRPSGVTPSAPAPTTSMSRLREPRLADLDLALGLGKIAQIGRERFRREVAQAGNRHADVGVGRLRRGGMQGRRARQRQAAAQFRPRHCPVCC